MIVIVAVLPDAAKPDIGVMPLLPQRPRSKARQRATRYNIMRFQLIFARGC